MTASQHQPEREPGTTTYVTVPPVPARPSGLARWMGCGCLLIVLAILAPVIVAMIGLASTAVVDRDASPTATEEPQK